MDGPASPSRPPAVERQAYLEHQPTYWLKRAYQAMRRTVDEELRPRGVSLSQREALLVLHHEGPASQGQLVECLRLEQSSVSRLMEGLQRRGWVTIEPDIRDRRSRRAALTPAGKEILQATPGASQIAGSIIGEAVPGRDGDELLRLLRKCTDALEARQTQRDVSTE